MAGPSLVAVAVLSLTAMLASAETAPAERVRRAGMVIAFDGDIVPNALPRRGVRPVTAHLSGRVRAVAGRPLPQLRRLRIEINRHARLFTAGLPVCLPHRVSDAFAAEALRNCRGALIGSGRFGVQIAFPDQPPTYTRGRVYAFNSRVGRRKAVLMHVVTMTPVAVAITVPLVMTGRSRGDFGLVLTSPPLPELIGHYIYTTDFDFKLGRRFRSGGTARSFLSAGCPAPAGFPGAVFNLARATYEFTDGRRIQQGLTRNCRVAGG